MLPNVKKAPKIPQNFYIFVTIWVFELRNNLSFWVLSQFEYLGFVTICFFELSQFELSFLAIWVFEFSYILSFVSRDTGVSSLFVQKWCFSCLEKDFSKYFYAHINFFYWVLSQFKFLSFVKIWVLEYCHNFSLSFVTVSVSEFCHNLSFWAHKKLLSSGEISIWQHFWLKIVLSVIK